MIKTVKDIIQNYKSTIEVFGSLDKQVSFLTLDSREVKKDAMFFAVKGTSTDAHQYIPNVIEMGASVIVCSTLPKDLNSDVTYLLVEDVQQSCGFLASEYYETPSKHFKLVGVTGTNGKTTCTSILYHLFTSLGYQCGLISTVEYIIGTQKYNSTHTTPDPIKLNFLMSQMVEAGCEYCFMEVSSHAIVQGRINGLLFDGGVFTNITHDHLDYHKTFANYIQAKKGFFDMLPNDAFALTNKDDKNGSVMLQNTKANKYSYALKTMADFNCKIIESDFDGLLLKIDQIEAWYNLVGKFNAYNLLAAYSVAFLLGEEREVIIQHLSKQNRVNGRFEIYKSSTGVVAIVDYAHTPDALENVLDTINNIRSQNEKLISILGCGGNRDKEKRPEMGRIAAQKSNKVILTSDNPRTEDPQQIIEEMMLGIHASDYKKILKISDRKEAIRAGIMLCKKGDLILVAGKGHETYQEINGVKHPFDDRIIIQELFKEIQ